MHVTWLLKHCAKSMLVLLLHRKMDAVFQAFGMSPAMIKSLVNTAGLVDMNVIAALEVDDYNAVCENLLKLPVNPRRYLHTSATTEELESSILVGE
mmetsp:Transcript_31961/g.48304  ORF Transcript_31961/g.48304 Transcript_31961/m.48304 type:complete len:96 (-) Transcript_31961:17-304(-)